MYLILSPGSNYTTCSSCTNTFNQTFNCYWCEDTKSCVDKSNGCENLFSEEYECSCLQVPRESHTNTHPTIPLLTFLPQKKSCTACVERTEIGDFTIDSPCVWCDANQTCRSYYNHCNSPCDSGLSAGMIVVITFAVLFPFVFLCLIIGLSLMRRLRRDIRGHTSTTSKSKDCSTLH